VQDSFANQIVKAFLRTQEFDEAIQEISSRCRLTLSQRFQKYLPEEQIELFRLFLLFEFSQGWL